MVPRTHDCPAWRAFGAALGAFAIAIQVLLTAWIIGQAAAAAVDQPDLAVICAHDPAATTDGGAPAKPHPHGQCAACACPQSAQLLAPPPAPASHALPLPRSAKLPALMDFMSTQASFHSPYASRAPPFSA